MKLSSRSSNVNNNAVLKKEKYLNLINEMSRNYRCVRFVNLSMSSLGSDECSTFLDMMNGIGIDKKQQRYIIKKMINIAIRATYYIFCCINRNWDSPVLMQFWFYILLLLLFVVLPDCLSVVVVLCLKNYGTSRHCKYTCTLYVNGFYFLFFVVVVVFSEN